MDAPGQPLIIKILVGNGIELDCRSYCRSGFILIIVWDTIPAIIVELDGLQAELAEIDENLIRNELNQFERATWQARRKEIYEMLHPDTKHGANQHTIKESRSRQLGDSSEKEATPSYVESAAKAQGKSNRTIEREAQRGKSLKPIAHLLKGTRFEDSGSPLNRVG